VRVKNCSGVLLTILLVASIVALSLVTTTTFQTASANPSSENFTIIVLPDTQYYSQSYPEIFENQTDWIVQNENKLNIVFVSHLGDLVEHYDSYFEWTHADNAMSVLDANKIPYAVLPGNHDMDGGYSNPGPGAALYENHFPASRFEGYSWWGGSYDTSSVISLSPNMNNYQLFTWDGMKFITLSLQYNPPADVRAWADAILSEYSDRRAIISTHSYINSDNSWAPGGPVIWRDVVTPNKNVFLVLCGHELGEAEKVDNLDNRMVYQLLSDYQGFPQGGDGWLRIMKFVPSQNMIYVTTYSPYLDNYRTNTDYPESQFELYYPMSATASSSGGISLMVYVGAIIVVVVIIAVVLIIKVL
jgi:hypothetical protein